MISGVAGDVCGECEGLWLDHDVIIAYLQEHMQAAGLPNKTVGLLETPPVSTEFRCPFCETESMVRLKLRAVEVERCTTCRGVFFDSGELSLIAKRLGFATSDSNELNAKREAASRHPNLARDVENAIGGAMESAAWGFGLDL